MKTISCLLGVLVLAIFFSVDARAVELVTNGGFETGTFAGWTVTNAPGSWNNWQNSPAGAGGTFIPVPVATSPQEGSRVAWNGITANANGVYSMTQDVVIPNGNIIRMSWKDRIQYNLTSFCTTPAACGTATYTVQILNTSNVVLMTMYTVNMPTQTNTNTGWVTHNVGLGGFQGQTIRIRFMDSATVTLAGPGQAEIDAVSIQALPPTASNVSLGGRVAAADGRGIGGVSVSFMDADGVLRSALTSPLGYYRIDDVQAGLTYIVTAGSKRYTFADNPRAVTLNDELANVDFTASP